MCKLAPLFALVSFSALSYSQPHDTLWKVLLQKPGQPSFVWSRYENNPYEIFDSTLTDPARSMPIKMNEDLYLWIDGTGRLFRMHFDSLARTYQTTRLENTRFVGYNYMAFPFAYKGKIYNLGGYGYWKRNGLLRQFNAIRGEWDIVKLNREIPVALNISDDFVWMDPDAGKIYIIGYAELNDGLNTPPRKIDKIMVLDLQKKEWTEWGSISSYLKNLDLPRVTTVAMAPTGLILRASYKEFIFLSFRENKIYHIDNAIWDHFALTKGEIKQFIQFFIDSTLYSYNYNTGKMDSWIWKSSYLTDTHQPIVETPLLRPTYMYSALLLLLLLPVFLYRKRLFALIPFPKEKDEAPARAPVPQPVNEMLQLDTLEEIVLKLIYEHSILQSNTSIEEINTVLGLSKRNADVQKKLRSDCIQSINHKLGILWGMNRLIIDKKRADFDKRSFEYFIATEAIENVKEYLIKSNNKG